MAKLLCSLFLVGFVFQANAFSSAVDPPNPPLDHWIPSIFNHLDWIPKIASFFNPWNWVTNIPNWIDWIPNPFKYLNYPFKFLPGIGHDICTLKADKGPCKAMVTRYYYDHFTDACKQFKYGGCKGNRNNFKQKDECEKACRGH